MLPRPQKIEALLQRHGERFKWLALLVIGLGTVAGVLSTTAFGVAVPTLTRHFGLGQEQVQWAITGYMTAMTVAMLPTPWFLDRFGFRRLFLAALGALALTSIAGSLAANFPLVVAARVAQGLAAGLLQPLGTFAVMRLFPTAQQGRAGGTLGFGIVLAPAIAPALGGLLLDHFGWRSIFLLNLPFCLIAGVLGLYLLPTPRERLTRRFDWKGLILLCLATLTLIEGLASLQHSGPGAPWTWGNVGVAAVTLALFIRHGRRAKAPIVSLGLFRHRVFTMGAIVSFSYGFGLYASTYLIPVFLQNAIGYSPTVSGSALFPSGIALAITIPIAGRLADRFSPHRLTACGLALFAVSFLAFAVAGGEITHTELIAATIVGRVGLGLILPALSMATLRHLEPHQMGQSSTVISYLRQVGGVLGIAVAAVFIQWRETIHGVTPPGIFTAYAQGFLLIAVVFLFALAAAVRMKPAAPAPLPIQS